MNLSTVGYRPVMVTINGEYMGIHNIRSKVNEAYVSQSFDIPEGVFDMIEQGDYAEVGDLTAYNYLLEVLNQDLSDESNFDQVRELINIENYTDFVIMQVFSVNTSVNHNTMAWKPKENGKWQCILVDVDRGFIKDELPYYEIE